jgi:type VI secretion system protein ImpB
MVSETEAPRSLLQREAARIQKLRFLRPDAAVQALTEAVKELLWARADEHLGALACATGAPLDPPREIFFEHSLATACARWHHEWLHRRVHDDTTRAWVDALERVELARSDRDLFNRSREAWECLRLAVQSVSSVEAWPASLATAWRAERPPEHAIARHLEWCAAHGDDPAAPSPWLPLVSLWELGVAPIPLPEGRWLFYVPALHDGLPVEPSDAAIPRALDDLPGPASVDASAWPMVPLGPRVGFGLPWKGRFLTRAETALVAPRRRVNIEYKSALAGARESIELPLKIMVVGDYTLRPDARMVEDRAPVDVDKDNFDEVLAAQKLGLDLTVADKLSLRENATRTVHLGFKHLADFSPDGVVEQVPELRALVEQRRALCALRDALGDDARFMEGLGALVRAMRQRSP